MKKIHQVIAAMLVIVSVSFAQTTWHFDKSHSKVGFSVTHLIISEVDGKFNSFDGTVVTDSDNFDNAKIDFTIDVQSVDTDNEKRDGHLKSPDFFNAAEFASIIFKSKKFEKSGEGSYKITGDLTMRGVTKEIVLDAKYNGTIIDPWGNTKAGFQVTGELNRFDYGLKWNALMEAGGAVVSQDVMLKINVELVKES